MEEDFFLKNMKGEKPFKKGTSIVKTNTTNKTHLTYQSKIIRLLLKLAIHIMRNKYHKHK